MRAAPTPTPDPQPLDQVGQQLGNGGGGEMAVIKSSFPPSSPPGSSHIPETGNTRQKHSEVTGGRGH